MEQRDAAAEALLSDRQGWGEGQRPQALVWTDRALNALLIEEEKVRTLSRSTAQITFRDDSRLRLNANSQALIQRMRVDPLSRDEEAKVSLIEGDFYALLAGKSQRRNFELEVPEVETRIDSTNFRVRRDDSGSKFTNYDERLLQVSAQGESVEVAEGNFQARVEGVRSRDEIGDLARRMNDMVVGLNERFRLAKFVSSGTLAAIKLSDHQGVRLGGERRLVTMMFCDIRGYTAFAERHDPEVVVEVLNLYFQHLAELVVSHDGDIDKYVGDQIVAVFQGEAMVANAVRCALAMQGKMSELGSGRPDWDLSIGIGINTGEVIMGAMGSRERMDYTVLGDHVNLAARLCARAGPGKTLISDSSCRAIAGSPQFAITALARISHSR